MAHLVNVDDLLEFVKQTAIIHGGKTSAHVVGEPLGPEGLEGSGEGVLVTSGSAQSSVINADVVDISPTTDCFIRFGSSPTAVANSDYFLPAGIVARFPITSGNRVAVIRASADGVMYVHPVQ